ncbi:MAG TPA: AraC family transcriptional regulator [Lachnospiraceae bacterium]|nr:AraC family transcriptional regulator [Lachnospiraceae bacterium]
MKKWKAEILPDTKDPIYEQRETGTTHTPFRLEYVLYQSIMQGNKKQMILAIEEYLQNGLVIGRLSKNAGNQTKYWAVSCIATAIHYAILGGLDETDAYNLSDQYIRHIDRLTELEACIEYLEACAIELVEKVADAKTKEIHSPAIKQCIHYIHIHLHEKLVIEALAKEVGLSRDYLSVLFKSETGTCLHAYILREKLEASKGMLSQGLDYDTIAYNLAFCSESHYISGFKKEYGITPGEYRRTHPVIRS